MTDPKQLERQVVVAAPTDRAHFLVRQELEAVQPVAAGVPGVALQKSVWHCMVETQAQVEAECEVREQLVLHWGA